MTKKTKQTGLLAGAILAGMVLMAGPARAALTNNTAVVSLMTNGGANSSNASIVASWGGNPILPGNLAQGGTMTLLSGGYPFGGSVANLNDGLMLSSVDPAGGPYTVDNSANSATFSGNPAQFKLVLAGTYDLAKIDVFTSYAYTRTGQKWSVFTSSDSGTTWSPTALAAINYLNDGIDTWQSRRVSVFDDASAAIATGVNALRFDIFDTDLSGGGAAEAVYSEVAVYAVPESGTAALAAIGLAALAFRLRKRR
jgi:hypothetical protein